LVGYYFAGLLFKINTHVETVFAPTYQLRKTPKNICKDGVVAMVKKFDFLCHRTSRLLTKRTQDGISGTMKQR